MNFDEIHIIEIFKKSFFNKYIFNYLKIDYFMNNDKNYINNF